MKKNKILKTVGSALLVLTAALSFAACKPAAGTSKSDPAGEDTKTDSYKEMTNEFQTYYLNIADADLGGLEGFHLKNLNTDKTVGVIIDKIFASDSMSEDGAVAVYNFDDPETGSNYWGFGAGTIADGVWSSGEIEAAPETTGETYITGFASPEFATKLYVGIVAKNLSDSVKGDDISLIPIIGDPVTDKAITFRSFVTK